MGALLMPELLQCRLVLPLRPVRHANREAEHEGGMRISSR